MTDIEKARNLVLAASSAGRAGKDDLCLQLMEDALRALDGDKAVEWTVGRIVSANHFRGFEILDARGECIAIVVHSPLRFARLPVLEKAAEAVVAEMPWGHDDVGDLEKAVATLHAVLNQDGL